VFYGLLVMEIGRLTQCDFSVVEGPARGRMHEGVDPKIFLSRSRIRTSDFNRGQKTYLMESYGA
jgi:hypothetical protein